MSQYARIVSDIVVELFVTPPGVPIEACFHAGLVWVRCDGVAGIAVGWSAEQINGSWLFAEPRSSATLMRDAALASLVVMLGNKEMAGVYFTPTGASQALLFPTDANAQIKYTAEWNMIGATPPLRTDGDSMIAADGTPVALSNTDAKALVEKALAYIKGCSANYAVLQPQVLADAATDVSTGWPVNT